MEHEHSFIFNIFLIAICFFHFESMRSVHFQILFKWKYGQRLSPTVSRTQFNMPYLRVAFFGINPESQQTGKIRISQRHLMSFDEEPNINIDARKRRDEKQFVFMTSSMTNAMILANLQRQIMDSRMLPKHFHIDNDQLEANLAIKGRTIESKNETEAGNVFVLLFEQLLAFVRFQIRTITFVTIVWTVKPLHKRLG